MSLLAFNAIVGRPKANGVDVVIVALDNAPVTWAVAGQTDSVTLVKWADDRPAPIPSGPRAGQTWAGWIGSFSVTVAGLPLQQFTGTITHNGVPMTFSFRLAPVRGQKWRAIMTTCYDPVDMASENLILHDDFFSADTQSVPVAVAVNNDDLRYTESFYDDLANSGHIQHTNPQSSSSPQYDFAIQWLHRLGMTGVGFYESGNRRYFAELNHLFNPGNHERVTYPGGLAVWNSLFAHCRGDAYATPIVTGLTHPWQIVLGDLKIVSPDYVQLEASNTDHVVDTLTQLGTNQALKLLFMSRPRPTFFPYDSTRVAWNAVEARLYVASGQTPKSISDNPATNGTDSCLAILYGDLHHGGFGAYFEPAGAGTVLEKFSIWLCGGTTSVGHTVGPQAEGTTANNATLVYKQLTTPDTDPRGEWNAITRLTVYGNEYPARMVLEHRRQGPNYGAVATMFSREWRQYKTDNHGAAVGSSTQIATPVSSGGSL